MPKCRRCDSDPCICGDHSFELGILHMAVGRVLHELDKGIPYLIRVYRDVSKHIPGQYCNGCLACPTVPKRLRA